MVLVPQAAKSLQVVKQQAEGMVVSVAEAWVVVEAKSLLEAAQPLLAQLLDERPAHARSGNPARYSAPAANAGRGTP